MSRLRRAVAIIIVLCLAAALATREHRALDRLFFADHTLSWQMSTSASGAYTGLRYAPFRPDLDGALFPVGRMPLLDIRIRPDDSTPEASQPVTLAAILTPPPHQSQPHLSFAAPDSAFQALARELDDVPRGPLVQWSLEPYATDFWQPISLTGDGAEFTGLRSRPAEETPPLPVKVPAPWGVLIFRGDSTGGRVCVSTGRDYVTHELHDGQKWTAVLVAPPGRRPAPPRAVGRSFSSTFGNVGEVRFVPLSSLQPATAILTEFVLDGQSIELSQLQDWPRSPGLALELTERGLKIKTRSPEDFLELPRALIQPSRLRLVLGWVLATSGLTLLGLLGLRLLTWLNRPRESRPGATAADAQPTPVAGTGWMIACLAALLLHLTYYAIAVPIRMGAGKYYAKVAHELWDYATAGILYFYRTPFHILFLRGLFELADSAEFVALVQHLMSVLNVYLVWRIAKRIELPRFLAAGVAVLVALHPRLHYFAGTYWNETLILSLLLITVDLLLISLQRGWGWAILAGLVCAAAALTRPQYQFIMGLMLVIYLLTGGAPLRRRLSLSFGLLLGFFTLSAPWLAYNHARNIPGFAVSHAHLAAYHHAPEIPAVRKVLDWHGRSRKSTSFGRGLDLARPGLDASWEEVRRFHEVIRARIAQQKSWQAETYRRKPRTMLLLIGRIFGFQAGWIPRPEGVFNEDLSEEYTRQIRLREGGAEIAPWRIVVNDWLADWHPRAMGCAYALAVLGAALSIGLRNRAGLLLAGVGLGNAALLAVLLLHSRRYTLPTEPFVILLGAWALWRIFAAAKRRLGMGRDAPRRGDP